MVSLHLGSWLIDHVDPGGRSVVWVSANLVLSISACLIDSTACSYECDQDGCCCAGVHLLFVRLLIGMALRVCCMHMANFKA